MAKTPRSLEQFAKENPQHHQSGCWATRVPLEVRKALDTAKAKGIPVHTVHRWVREEMRIENATLAKVRRHVNGECLCAR